MNKDKFNSQDIVDALSQHAGCSKQLGDAFLKAFVSSVEDALLQKDTVKVKNFGSFKLNWVAPRKSVNVHSGRSIVLDGYYKVSFTPENELKKLVNAPYAHLETVVLAGKDEKKMDPLFSLSEQASEIKGLLSEIETMPRSGKPSKEEEIMEEQKLEEASLDEPIVSSKSSEEMPSVGKKKNKRLAFYFVLLLAFIFLSYFFFTRYDESVLAESMGSELKSESQIAPSPSSSAETLAVLSLDSALLSDGDLIDSTEVQVVAEDFKSVFDNRLQNSEAVASISLQQGQYLASLAKEYYGSAHFWVYIYEFNRDQIKNKNSLRAGMLIRIPKLDARLIDLTNPRSLESAKDLETLYGE